MRIAPHPLIYDWNHDAVAAGPTRPVAMLDDETLRDGLQSPSVRTPTIDEKIDILHHMDALGIDTADIGLPGAGPKVAKDVERLARAIVVQAGADRDRHHRAAAAVAHRDVLPALIDAAPAATHRAGVPRRGVR